MKLETMRALDHVIVAVRDLESAGASWERLGFQVLPRMPHVVSGSANRIIQFAGSYVELLGEIESLISPDYRRHYGGRFAYGEGLANICFSTDDLAADHAAIGAAGVTVGPIASARRPIVMPDGRSEMTDTDYFYPHRDGHAYATPFLAMHRKPETIFVREYQDHPNTACDIVGVVQYSAAPAQDAEFFAQMSGGAIDEMEGGARLTLANGGAVDFLDARTLGDRYGSVLPPLDDSSDGYGVGLKIKVRSLTACRAALAHDIGAVDVPGGVIVPASAASGCFLLFSEEG